MALFMDLVALSNGLHGSVQMDSVALFSWIGWLHHYGIFSGHGWQEGIEADGKDACLKAVRTQLKSGVDLIKMMATGGVMTKGVEPGNAQFSV